MPLVYARLLRIDGSDGRGNDRKGRRKIFRRDTSRTDKQLYFRRTPQNARHTFTLYSAGVRNKVRQRRSRK
jgi:hypothetical protein